MNDMPKGYIRLSHATSRLADGIWGNLRRPDPVATIKRTQKKLSVGFGPWRETAGQRLRNAATNGELVVYVVAMPQASSKKTNRAKRSFLQIDPVVVPVNVLKQLITSRAALPDHPIRPSMKIAEGNEKLLALLTTGLLIFRTSDFEAWYRSERAKGKWASQRTKLKNGIGRPTKQTEALRNAILAHVRDLKWTGKAGVTRLHRMLVAAGRPDVPSPDTLARLIDQLHRETGEAGLLRIRRRTRG
jgi:hypothetical protein